MFRLCASTSFFSLSRRNLCCATSYLEISCGAELENLDSTPCQPSTHLLLLLADMDQIDWDSVYEFLNGESAPPYVIGNTNTSTYAPVDSDMVAFRLRSSDHCYPQAQYNNTDAIQLLASSARPVEALRGDAAVSEIGRRAACQALWTVCNAADYNRPQANANFSANAADTTLEECEGHSEVSAMSQMDSAVIERERQSYGVQQTNALSLRNACKSRNSA